jgi:tetratricopeptide (TPR) repeat protein
VTERDPNNQQYRYEIASAHHFLGMALAGGDDLKEALEHFDAAIVLRRDALAQDPRDARTRSMLAGNYSQRANVLLRINDRSAAADNASEAVDLQQSVLLADPNSTPARISMAEFEARLGEVHMSIAESKSKRDGVQHWRDAAEWYARAAARYDALEREGHLRSPQLRAEADRSRHLLVRCRSAVAGS